MSKRINATITDEQFALISESGLSNSEIVSQALTFFFERHDEHELLTSERDSLKSENETLRHAQTLLNDHNETLKQETETLKRELEKARLREENFQSVQNNYMLQVQSLINQKAIEAPGVKKWWKFW